MKQGYLKKMVVGGLLLSSLGLAACGSDGGGSSVVPTGKVVKGPVSGATVLDKNGNAFATTDANGVFSMTAEGPYTTSGGTYTPLNSDGTAGTPVAAPPMSAPAGYAQITPLSTIVASAPAAEQAAVEAKLVAALAKMGVTDLKNADLSVKTDANAAAIVFAESVGAVLSTAATAAGSTADASVKSAISSAITTALISAVNTLSTTATVNVAAITSAISTEVTSVMSSNTTIASALPTLASTITAATNTAADGANAMPNGSLPTTTGSTGGTGGTSGVK